MVANKGPDGAVPMPLSVVQETKATLELALKALTQFQAGLVERGAGHLAFGSAYNQLARLDRAFKSTSNPMFTESNAVEPACISASSSPWPASSPKVNGDARGAGVSGPHNDLLDLGSDSDDFLSEKAQHHANTLAATANFLATATFYDNAFARATVEESASDTDSVPDTDDRHQPPTAAVTVPHHHTEYRETLHRAHTLIQQALTRIATLESRAAHTPPPPRPPPSLDPSNSTPASAIPTPSPTLSAGPPASRIPLPPPPPSLSLPVPSSSPRLPRRASLSDLSAGSHSLPSSNVSTPDFKSSSLPTHPSLANAAGRFRSSTYAAHDSLPPTSLLPADSLDPSTPTHPADDAARGTVVEFTNSLAFTEELEREIADLRAELARLTAERQQVAADTSAAAAAAPAVPEQGAGAAQALSASAAEAATLPPEHAERPGSSGGSSSSSARGTGIDEVAHPHTAGRASPRDGGGDDAAGATPPGVGSETSPRLLESRREMMQLWAKNAELAEAHQRAQEQNRRLMEELQQLRELNRTLRRQSSIISADDDLRSDASLQDPSRTPARTPGSAAGITAWFSSSTRQEQKDTPWSARGSPPPPPPPPAAAAASAVAAAASSVLNPKAWFTALQTPPLPAERPQPSPRTPPNSERPRAHPVTPAAAICTPTCSSNCLPTWQEKGAASATDMMLASAADFLYGKASSAVRSAAAVDAAAVARAAAVAVGKGAMELVTTLVQAVQDEDEWEFGEEEPVGKVPRRIGTKVHLPMGMPGS